MKTKKTITLCTSLLLGSLLSLPGYADAAKTDTQRQSSESVEQKASDAWLEGKLDTVYLFNRQLDSFMIDPQVRDGNVVLTGKVESEVDRELAEQVALKVEGIKSVTNRLTVVPSDEARGGVKTADRSFSEFVEDATLTAEVKTKLLANRETHGLTIDVDTVGRSVTLSGHVASAAEKSLAESIAKGVDGVNAVTNKLQIKS
jgi:hyperosmotically inducible protein